MIVLLLLFLGCAPPPVDNAYAVDGDGDGFSPYDGDCDDEDPAVHPDADEVCNGIDDDCDGRRDADDDDAVDVPSWFLDSDGDGYGSSLLVAACEPEGNLVEKTGDCNDANDRINPDERERCNEVDDDCNGEIDDDVGTKRRYADVDGDGYGDPETETRFCSEPGSGWTIAGTDCDDTDPAVNPGAAESCNGQDDDCNGSVDDALLYHDRDGDGYGDATAPAGVCDTDAVGIASDCDDGDARVNPGAREYCDGIDENCDGTIDEDPVDGSWAAPDEDGDGFGGTFTMVCDGVDNELDCDDSDPSEPVIVDASTGSSAGPGTADAPYDTIQAGMDAAASCVLVGPGTYREVIDFLGKDLDVRSTDGSASTVIDATGLDDAVVRFENAETAAARLEGFTLTGGTGRYEATTTTTTVSSYLEHTDVYELWCGGGIVVDDADPTLVDLRVTGNRLPAASATVGTAESTYTYSFGGGICVVQGDPTLEEVVVEDNEAWMGGGLYVRAGTVTLDRGALWGNAAETGGGAAQDGGRLVLTNVYSAWNTATDSGGTVYGAPADLELVNVTVGGDDAPDGAIVAAGSGTLSIRNSIVWGAATGAGIVGDSGVTLTATYNDVYGNAAGGWSGFTDPTGSDGNIAEDPVFAGATNDGDPSDDDWSLGSGSPCLDAGDPSSAYDDADGSRNDMGATGGPGGGWSP